MTEELVDHPAHYGGADNPLEHEKVAWALGWSEDAYIYNCTKYLWRAGKKADAPTLRDLKKARWYLDKKIQRMEEAQVDSMYEMCLEPVMPAPSGDDFVPEAEWP